MYCQVFNFNSRVGSLNIRERILKIKPKRYIYIKEVACDFVRFVSLKEISLIWFRINEMTSGDFPQNIFWSSNGEEEIRNAEIWNE